MPKTLPRPAREHLEKARSSAIAAVDVYNRPGTKFRTPQYIVLIIIAWTAALHAIFYNNGIKPWYVVPNTGKRVRYKKVDGEPQHWALSDCLKIYYKDQNTAERQNLLFLIGLRNKIEHRHLPELDVSLYGECQAALQNLESLITREFGDNWALGENLAVALQFSSILPEHKKDALKKMAASSAQDVLEYVQSFRASLPDHLLNSPSFSFRVFLVPKTANRRDNADMAIEFVPYDPSKPEEMKELERVTTMVKEKQVQVQNRGLYRPGDVVRKLRSDLSENVNQNDHTQCWKFFKVRPRSKAQSPHQTDHRYCIYDEPHGDYLYTDAWIEKLKKELSNPTRYDEIKRYRSE